MVFFPRFFYPKASGLLIIFKKNYVANDTANMEKMKRFFFRKKYRSLSIIVNFYNMQREAKRTLFSLSEEYQKNVASSDYEVIVIDNGSTKPLDPAMVSQYGDNFRYVFFDAKSPSPCAALNYGVSLAKYENVMLCIDGARMFSPSILQHTLQMFSLHKNPFVYTVGMHLGAKPQNFLVEDGYNQLDEDKLLKTVDWKKNGYKLFEISSLALSAKQGIFSCLAESNCFAVRKKEYLRIGGFDERFISKGGGIVNLDIFARIISDDGFKRIMLLGESTFHQFHGGVATNVTMDKHPLEEMMKEYEQIKGKNFKFVFKMPDLYYGSYAPEYHEKFLSIPKKNDL